MTYLKRLPALILALVLAAAVLSGCANESQEATPDIPGERIAMLENWHRILQVNETVFGHMLWAYDHADTFCSGNDWNSLLTARAATNAALLALGDTVLPECTLTESQATQLIKDGIEADVVTMEYEVLESTVQSRKDTLTLLHTHLNNDVFLIPDLNTTRSWLESSQRCTRLEIEYLWHCTNYLLLQLAPTVNPQEQWIQWQQDFPAIAAFAPEWETDPDTIMTNTNALLDSLSEELVRYSGYLGRSEDSLLMVTEAVESGDLSTLSWNRNKINGVPGYIPAPIWLESALAENAAIYYLENPETEEILWIQAGQELTEPPTGCYIALPGVAKSDVEDYAALLEGMGYAVKLEWEEEIKTLHLLASAGQSVFMVEWADDTATLLLTDPIGCITPYLYLLADNQA